MISSIADIDCPYPGLRPFQREEAEFFFGRQELIGAMWKKLSDQHFLAVVGNSGCGKSSLVRAGLMECLASQYLAAEDVTWCFADMRPGTRPSLRLAKAVVDSEALSGGRDEEASLSLDAVFRRGPLGFVEELERHPLLPPKRLFVLVDQFEEVFRYRKEVSASGADAFVSLLLATAAAARKDPNALPVYITLTMRSDFLGHCAQFRDLPEAINDSQFLTPRLTRSQRRAAIVGPAVMKGGEVEPELVTTLLNDMGDDPDQLPIMQHAMMRMWRESAKPEHRTQAGHPTLELYRTLGAWEGTLSGHANEVFMELSAPQQRIAKTLFQCLADPEGAQQDTRRPVTLEHVKKVADVELKDVTEVVQPFRRPDRAFLRTSDDEMRLDTVVDISHESLIRLWGRLRDWTTEGFRDAETYRRLVGNAQLWKDHESGLLGGRATGSFVEWWRRAGPNPAWAERNGGNFELAKKFLDESRTHRTQLRLILGGVTIAVLVVISGLLWRIAAERNQKATEVKRRETVVADREEKIKKLESQLGALSQELEKEKKNAENLKKDAENLKKEADNLKKQAERDADNLKKQAERDADKLKDQAKTEAERLTLEAKNAKLEAQALKSKAFEAEEQAVSVRESALGFKAQTLSQRIDSQFDALVAGIQAVAPKVRAGAEPLDEARLGLQRAIRASLRSLPFKGAHKGRVTASLFALEDESVIVSVGRDATVSLWSVQPRCHLRSYAGQHRSPILVAVVSLDRTRLFTGGSDGSAFVWDIARIAPSGCGAKTVSADDGIRKLDGPAESITAAAFMVDEMNRERLVVGYADGACIIWDASSWEKLKPVVHQHSSTLDVIQSGPSLAGREARFVTAGADGTAKVCAAIDGREIRTLGMEIKNRQRIRAIAFSPDGTRIITCSDDYVAYLWNLDTGMLDASTLRHNSMILSAQFAPDEERKVLVTGTANGEIHQWEWKNGWDSTLGHSWWYPLRSPVTDCQFLPGNSRVVTAVCESTLLFRFVEHAATPENQTVVGGAGAFAVSRDGTRILVSGLDGSVHLMTIWNSDQENVGQDAAALVRTACDLLRADPNRFGDVKEFCKD